MEDDLPIIIYLFRGMEISMIIISFMMFPLLVLDIFQAVVVMMSFLEVMEIFLAMATLLFMMCLLAPMRL